jgi:hypothetical protein
MYLNDSLYTNFVIFPFIKLLRKLFSKLPSKLWNIGHTSNSSDVSFDFVNVAEDRRNERTFPGSDDPDNRGERSFRDCQVDLIQVRSFRVLIPDERGVDDFDRVLRVVDFVSNRSILRKF